jgi:dGTP triphosphohydrolase
MSACHSRQQGQRRLITNLFEIYNQLAEQVKEWRAFPAYYREHLEKASTKTELTRTCVDLIASMVETQAITMHQRLTGQSHSSGLDDILT